MNNKDMIIYTLKKPYETGSNIFLTLNFTNSPTSVVQNYKIRLTPNDISIFQK